VSDVHPKVSKAAKHWGFTITYIAFAVTLIVAFHIYDLVRG